jgi:hypothetical protein
VSVPLISKRELAADTDDIAERAANQAVHIR